MRSDKADPLGAQFRQRAGYADLTCARPKHLLSGKLTCGRCNGQMIRSGSEQRFVCSTHSEKGNAVCKNGRSAKGADIAERVLAALKDRLLAPDIAFAMEEARA